MLPQDDTNNTVSTTPSPPVTQPSINIPVPQLNHDLQDAASPLLLERIYSFGNDIIQGKTKIRVFLLLFILSIIVAVLPSIKLIRTVSPIIRQFDVNSMKIINEVYPKELEITIKNGKASTNVVEPYYLTISQQTLSGFFQQDLGKEAPISKIRLLAIDTAANAEDFDRYQSYALLTKNSLVYYNDDSISIQPLSSYPDTTITRDFLVNEINEINKGNRVITFLTWLLYTAPLIITIGYMFYYLFEVLSGAFLVWIINKILQTNIKFSHLFKLVAVAYIIPALILLTITFVPGFSEFYFWTYTALDVFILAGLYVFIKRYKTFSST